jgi:hypothetical protein
MKGHLVATATAVAIAAGAIVAFPLASSGQAPKKPAMQPLTQSASPPASAQAADNKGPNIIISVSGSATISTQGMSVGGEIWAEWYSLPPGQAVVEPGSAAKWAYLELTLDGSAAVTGGSNALCRSLGAGGHEVAASDAVDEAGDVEVCNYSLLHGSRRENRRSEPYIFAELSVGGPWNEDMEDAADQYLKVNGLAKAAHIKSSQFGEVEKQILKTGAMRVAIRRVTIPPGSRIVTTDHYPTLRMVEKGQLNLSSVPEGSNTQASKVLAAFDTMEWLPANADTQIVLSNTGNLPVQFVEWSVAPAQVPTP